MDLSGQRESRNFVQAYPYRDRYTVDEPAWSRYAGGTSRPGYAWRDGWVANGPNDWRNQRLQRWPNMAAMQQQLHPQNGLALRAAILSALNDGQSEEGWDTWFNGQ